MDQSGYFIYDNGQILLQLDSTGDVDQRLLWGSAVDQILADENGSGDVYWMLSDHQNTVRDVVEYDDATHTTTVVNHIAYNAFGEITSESNSSLDTLDLYYTARYTDQATGLQYNTNRWYNAALGRWISQDPIGFAAGDENLYRYVGNDPLNKIDPSGLQEEPHWQNGGKWKATSTQLHYKGHYGETNAGTVKGDAGWYDQLFDGPVAQYLAAGTIFLFDLKTTLSLHDTVVCGDRKVEVNIDLTIQMELQWKTLNRVGYVRGVAWLIGLGNYPGSTAMSRYTWTDTGIRSVFGAMDMHKLIREKAEMTQDLTRLYTILDNDMATLQVSPATVLLTGLDRIDIAASGIDLGTIFVDYGPRGLGSSRARPWKSDKWADGVWNADETYDIFDFEIPFQDSGTPGSSSEDWAYTGIDPFSGVQ